MTEIRKSIRIKNEVIKSIVLECSKKIPGVAGLSGGKFYDNLVSWGKSSETKGIEVFKRDDSEEDIERIDIHIEVENGMPFPTVAKNLQQAIGEIVGKMTNKDVPEINVYVDEIREKSEPTTGEEEEASVGN